MTFPISGPGSVGMEACFVNLMEPGDKAIVCRNGVFGGRMVENVERSGGVAVVVDDEWGRPVSVEKVEAALEANPDARIVAFVQAETSTGAHTDPGALVALAHEHDCLTIVDTVTAVGGVPVLVDEWNIDAIYAGTQKCLSCPPGLAPVSFGERALERVRARATRCQSWFMDLNLQLGYWSAGTRTYHHTAPVNALYGLHESLLLLHEEGLEAAWARHRRNHEALVAGFDAMGLRQFVPRPTGCRSSTWSSCPKASTRRSCAGGCSTNTTSRSAPASARCPARSGASGSWATPAPKPACCSCLDAYESVLSDLGFAVTAGAGRRAARRGSPRARRRVPQDGTGPRKATATR